MIISNCTYKQISDFEYMNCDEHDGVLIWKLEKDLKILSSKTYHGQLVNILRYRKIREKLQENRMKWRKACMTDMHT